MSAARLPISAAAALLLLSLLTSDGAAKLVGRAGKPSDPPCQDCLFVPAKGERRPLLVLLHGDRQPPRRMIRAFRAAAARRDIALLAPPCPEELGCDRRSFWRWNGDPVWLAGLIDRAIAQHGLDPERVALVGWSGGATYLGKHMAALGDRYSAAVLVGGGMPGEACAAAPLPVFLLQGDRNPMHHLTVALRERLQQCEHEVVWQVVRGADHAAEWKALTRPAMQRAIFDFLDAHPRRGAATPEPDLGAAPAAR